MRTLYAFIFAGLLAVGGLVGCQGKAVKPDCCVCKCTCEPGHCPCCPACPGHGCCAEGKCVCIDKNCKCCDACKCPHKAK